MNKAKLKIDETKSEKYLNMASELFIELSENERKTMERLKNV